MSAAQAETQDHLTGAEDDLGERMRDPASRRSFLRLMGTGGAAGGAALLAACGGAPQAEKSRAVLRKEIETSPFGPGDIGIANFALLLEFFEAEFYDRANASGELKNRRVEVLFKKIGQNENEHVDALQSLVVQLGATAVKRPEVDIDRVLEGGERSILKAAAEIENLGASAYLGQADKVQNKNVLDAALRIHTVEARHAAVLNELAGNGFRGTNPLKGSVPDGAFAKPMSAKEVLKAAGKYLKDA